MGILRKRAIPVYDEELKCLRYRLPDGADMLLDVEDAALLGVGHWRRRWNEKTGKYGNVSASTSIQRVIVLASGTEYIDHKNRDSMDCRKINLRPATKAENSRNRRKPRFAPGKFHGCTSTFKGVWRFHGKWAASIRIDNKSVHLGSFDSEQQAADAYDAKAVEVWGDFAGTNAASDAPPPLDTDVRVPMGNADLILDPNCRWILSVAKWCRVDNDQIHAPVAFARLVNRPRSLDVMVDHQSGDGLDCRRQNLREATHGQNCQNAGKRRHGHTCRFKGVSWNPGHDRWQATIMSDRKRKHIGYFRTSVSAANAYDEACRRLHGAFAKTNAELGLYDSIRDAKSDKKYNPSVRGRYKTKYATPYRGVYRESNGPRYRASIFVDGKSMTLGHSHDPLELARRYDAAAIKHRGPNATTNASLGLLSA